MSRWKYVPVFAVGAVLGWLVAVLSFAQTLHENPSEIRKMAEEAEMDKERRDSSDYGVTD